MSAAVGFHLERQWAAELVRGARRAVRRGDDERAAELLDWALLIVPNLRAAQRLRIKVFLKTNDIESAQAMIARRLLERSSDLPLLLLQAMCLRMNGDLRRAEEVLHRVQCIAPHRRDAIELAGEVALALGDYAHSIDLYMRLLTRHPRDRTVHLALVHALIESKDAENARHAERLLMLLDDPPSMLLARSYMAQGRWRDAADRLGTQVEAVLDRAGDEEADALLALYVQALEACGEMDQIDALAKRIKVTGFPRASLRIAQVTLAHGRFREAAQRLITILRNAPSAHHAPAVALAVASSTLAGRTRMARCIVSRDGLSHHRSTASSDWIDAWRRGLRGRILADQRSACGARPGGDPSPSVLRPLLRRAVSTLQERLVEKKVAGEVGASQVERDLATCRAALGVM